MLFSSLIFIFYFLPVVLTGYALVGFSRTAQDIWLLLASLFFYAWGEPLFVFVMMASIAVNWLIGLSIGREKKRLLPGRARALLVVAIVFNVGILFVYKYLGFVVDNINYLVGHELLPHITLHLPLGISFFTFQAMSYVFDVYKDEVEVERNPFYVGLYIALFPQLVAGPIVRYADIAEQMRQRKVTWDMFSSGCSRFVIGVGKKILIANSMGAVSDRVFDLSGAGNHVYIVPSMLAWLGLLAYTLQIFFDFSSYSDMAIGLGRMFGFTFKENFNYPYISSSVTEFWRRWHISLSTWFKEYVYIPLGGSRGHGVGIDPAAGKKSLRLVRNLFVVWLLTGIWHGANWTFIVWGMWHFLAILMERVTKINQWRVPTSLRHAYVLFVVMIGWMFFRSTSMANALAYLANLFAINNNGLWSDFAVLLLRENLLFFAAGLVFSTPAAREFGNLLAERRLGGWGPVFSLAYPLVLFALLGVSVVYLAKGSYAPFIYFNF